MINSRDFEPASPTNFWDTIKIMTTAPLSDACAVLRDADEVDRDMVGTVDASVLLAELMNADTLQLCVSDSTYGDLNVLVTNPAPLEAGGGQTTPAPYARIIAKCLACVLFKWDGDTPLIRATFTDVS
jgi:hypothetical protein